MTTFSKRQYIWLESFFRDELRLATPEQKPHIEQLIENLSRALKSDAPDGFLMSSFYHAIFSPIITPSRENKEDREHLTKMYP